MSQSLDLRQGQQLVMTPQLQQAIKLLQLNNMELTEFVEQELEHNPLLEKDERPVDDTPTDDRKENDTAADSGPDEVEEAFESANTNDDFDPGSSMANIGAGGNSKFEDRRTALKTAWPRKNHCASISPSS